MSLCALYIPLTERDNRPFQVRQLGSQIGWRNPNWQMLSETIAPAETQPQIWDIRLGSNQLLVPMSQLAYQMAIMHEQHRLSSEKIEKMPSRLFGVFALQEV